MMGRRAVLIIGAVILGGVLGTVISIPGGRADSNALLTFLLLCILATAAQLFRVQAPNHQTYFATPIFAFATLFLLPPLYFALVVLISYSAEWIKERVTHSPLLRDWYLQPFNISAHILAGFAAWILYVLLARSADFGVMTLAAMSATVIYVLVNHALVGMAIALARGIGIRKSGVFEAENLAADFILLALGFTVAVLWRLHPLLIIPALSPLFLIYRALMVPQLKSDAQTDGKTGLWNARHFASLFVAEFGRAGRFERSLAFVMADLDLLRNINNSYGHLAGDQVLIQVAGLIRGVCREYDIAGRFGGEEFCLALPETTAAEGWAIAERLRQAVEAHPFRVGTSATPIHVTLSLGVAARPEDAGTPLELVHEADVAVYQAKLEGRNRTILARDVPAERRAGMGIDADRLASPFITG